MILTGWGFAILIFLKIYTLCHFYYINYSYGHFGLEQSPFDPNSKAQAPSSAIMTKLATYLLHLYTQASISPLSVSLTASQVV